MSERIRVLLSVEYWSRVASGIKRGVLVTPSFARCGHEGEFHLVRHFHGCDVWQCATCRTVYEVNSRVGKTCVACGKPLVGRQSRWCSPACGIEFANCKSRSAWSDSVKKCDNYTCARCGWSPSKEGKQAFTEAIVTVWNAHKTWGVSKCNHEAAKLTDWRFLESHHIVPLERGGPEFDLDNGVTLCHLCHDEEHRRLNREASSCRSGG